jgi:hypothetical protein
MPTPLEVESLFAAIGLQSILDARPSLHKYQLQMAAGMPKEMRRRLLAFLASDAFRPAVDVPEFDYAKTLDVVSGGQTPEQTRELSLAVPDPDLAMDLGIQANRITTWANGIIPRDERTIVGGGLRRDDPEPHATADFRRVWNIALDPMSVLADLEDGSLSDDQVAALALLYPALYAEMRQAVKDDMATMSGRRGIKWEPAPPKAALLGVLLQEDETDPTLTAAVQAIYAKQPEAPPPGKPSRATNKAAGGSTELTPGEKAAGA